MDNARRPAPPGPPPIVWAFALVFAAFELVFQAADAGILPIADLRWTWYGYLAFWDVLFESLRDDRPVPAFFWTSFVTHGFLHGSMFHLIMNTAVFLGLGGLLANALGAFRFIVLFAVTAIGGALTFALVSDFNGPLVGASGALFGFIGAMKCWELRYILATGASARRFWGTIVALTIMNVALYFAFPGTGALAWEAHLGGFVAGFLVAPILAPGAAAPSPI